MQHSSPFADHLRFLKALITRPKSIGALLPSSPALGAAMARQIILPGPVLELGPGTGAITAEILAHGVTDLTCVEYDAAFARALKCRFPDVRVVEGDAFDLAQTLGPHGAFSAVLSGLPLLNFPVAARHRLIEGALTCLAPGGAFVQFSYGAGPPVAPPPGYIVTKAVTVWANLPPARVWVYRRA